MLATVVAAAPPFVLAGEKDFLHLPDVEDFRTQHITRTGQETAWPFTVDEGYRLGRQLMSRFLEQAG